MPLPHTAPLPGLPISRGDLIRAHNLLEFVVNGHAAELELSSLDRINLYAYRDFACWALGHESNPTASRVLEELRLALQKLGYTQTDFEQSRHLTTPPRPF